MGQTNGDSSLEPLLMRPPLPSTPPGCFTPPTMPMMAPPPWAMFPPPPPDRRLPPAGRIASPPGFDRRSFSPASDHSHHRYSPEHDRRHPRRGSFDRHSPDRWFTRSPPGGGDRSFERRHRSPPRGYYDEADNDESGRIAVSHRLGKFDLYYRNFRSPLSYVYTIQFNVNLTSTEAIA